MKTDKTDKDILGLAAEFAVAGELCRRNIYAQLTLGFRKRTDILVETKRGMLRIQVKGKQGKEWPGVKGIYGEDIVLIFVDFEKKRENERPDFYILTVEDWKNLLKNELIMTGKVESGEIKIDEDNMPIWRDRYQGMGIKPAMIKEYKERWDKIKEILFEDPQNASLRVELRRLNRDEEEHLEEEFEGYDQIYPRE
jgi:hypothetical protein